jgi:hypothetical protein
MIRKARKSYVASIAPIALVASAVATAAPTPVSDFGLIDHQGVQHQLSRLGENKAVVIMSQSNSCAENIDSLPRFKLLRTMWGKQGVKFLMLNADTSDTPATVRAQAAAFEIDFPIMLDESQLAAENLGITKAGEIVVVDPNTRQLLFRGPMDRAAMGGGDDDGPRPNRAERADRPAPSTPLADVLGKVVAGKAATDTVVADVPKGCAYNLTAKAAHGKAIPDYATAVAPLLKEKCGHCHVQGGIGPFAMTSYEVIKGFSPMIKEVLLTKRMPPAQVDPHVNHFQNANYISNGELQTLVHWIDAGAPRGAAKKDPLAAVKPITEEWQLGPPDYIVELPPYEVPATGVIDYFNHIVELPFKDDMYVRAIQFIPGDKRVLHHLLSYSSTPNFDRGQPVTEENVRDFLEGYAPGKSDATQFPKDTGVFLPKGNVLVAQMHYTTMGKAVTDRTRIGLYFHKSPPKFKYLTYPVSLGGANLAIAPGNSEHRMNSSYAIKEDMMLYAMRPHMHYRGKAFRFSVLYPDMRREVLINVPNYNFAWQPTYRLDKPILIPAGSRIFTDGIFDNSKFNLGNPDPSVTAKGGPQSWDEMFIGYLTYTLPNKDYQSEKSEEEQKNRTANTR